MTYEYKTKGTCSSRITFDLDGDVVRNVKFTGGCNGNLKGISAIVDGMKVGDIEEKLSGITCGGSARQGGRRGICKTERLKKATG